MSWTSGYVADLGYTHGFYRELTPTYLSFVGLAQAQRAPDSSESLNYCELGCGQGVTANLLAASNPPIQFYATDFNPSHIVGARALASEAHSNNIHFFDESFSEFLENRELPSFDYISLHGIYSWITVENRSVIVDFIRRKLKPGGLVYISYNSQPGWAAAAPLRHLMFMHGRATGGPTAGRVDPAIQFVDRMISANAGFFRSNPNLRARYDKLKTQNRSYVAHEYMNEAWALLYHSEVVSDLDRAKLSFLGSASLLDDIPAINLSPDQQEIMAEIADPVLRETVRDYMVNQQFRRDVFVKGGVSLSNLEQRSRWLNQRFALSTARPDVPMTVKGALGTGDMKPELYGPILDELSKGPRSVAELLSDPTLARLELSQVVMALKILVGTSHVQPCPGVEGEGDRTERTRAFNRAVWKRAEASAELQALASPVTAGGVGIDRFSQLFLRARDEGQSDPPLFVWNILLEQGTRLLKDEKTLETAEENVAELRRIYEEFHTKRIPILQQLGIAPN